MRAFLWGKRRSHRHAVALDVSIRGPLGVIPAMSLDLSATGVQLRIPAEALAPDAAGEGEVDPYVLVQTHFRKTCQAHFKRCRVKAYVNVVRLDFRPDEPDFLYVGCRFARPLDSKQLKRFGLSMQDCLSEAHALPSEMVPFRAADDPLLCRVYPGGKKQELIFEGFVLGLGDKTLCLRLDDADVGVVARTLRSKGLRAEVYDGDQVDWKTDARLQAIGFLQDDRRALELGLVVDKPPGEALKKKFLAPKVDAA